jgi:hypothetical protein
VNNKYAAIIATIFAAILSLHAQPANVQQFQNVQQQQQFQQPITALPSATNAPELFPGENTDVGPQFILRQNIRPDYFDVFFDSQYFYSDNANFASGSDMIGSPVYVNTVQAAFTPPDMKLGDGKFAPAIGFVSQWYNYDNNQLSSLDFNAQTAFISGRYTYKDWQFGLGLNYTRLLDQGSYDQTYSEFLPALTVQRFFPIGEKLILVAGNQLDYHFSSVPQTAGGPCAEINNRLDDAASLTLSWLATKRLTVQPYFRFQYSNYRYNTLQTSGRNDYLTSFGMTLVYYLNKNLSLRYFINYNIKRSDDAYSPSYDEYNTGIGGTLNFNF